MLVSVRGVKGLWVCVCVSLGVVLGGATVAFAAAPEAPWLALNGRGASQINLWGVLYPNAPGEAGSYEFLYKQSATECEGGEKTAVGSATGNQFQEVYETLSGLQSGKQYTICLALTSPGGTTLSAPVTVTTAIPPETPEGLKVTAVEAKSATVEGILNPVAERQGEPGFYEFLYKRSETECEGEETTGAAGSSGARGETVSAPLAKLLPHTTYTFCLRQSNEVGEVATSAPVSFTTLAAAPTIEEVGAVHVTAESATFTATVNPQGAETSYVFEYAPVGGTFTPVPTGRGTLQEGPAGVAISTHVQGLSAHTTYEFRVSVTNAVGTETSKPASITTQTAGQAFSLRDGRQWEMVSPLQKEGALFGTIGQAIIQAAADGNAVTDWTRFEPIEAQAAAASGFYEANFFGRGATGWASKTISPPHPSVSQVPVGYGMEYRIFSEDLSKAILQPFGEQTPLAPDVSESTAYIRTDYLGGDRGNLCQSGCYQSLVSDSNVPAGVQYGHEEGAGTCRRMFCGPEVLAATPDLSHVLLSSEAELAAGTNGGIYEWTGGKLAYVGVGARGTNTAEGSIGTEGLLRHVISNDGSRVFLNGSYEGTEGLLLRDTVTGEVTRIDAPQGSVPPVSPGGSVFQTASSDGSRAFFTSASPLIEGAGEGDLYEYDANAPAGNRLTDLSVDPNPGEASGVSVVIGASEDGSYVYFTATGALAPGAKPTSCSRGACPGMNLYVRHGGTTTFLAELSGEDRADWTPRVGYADGMTARVSPDGRWLAFMSNRSLTGYDNMDAVSGRPAEEVYLYSASSAKLVCASCNPSGARPSAVEYGNTELPLVAGDDQAFSYETWIASSVPTWTRYTGEYAVYQSRYLSDSGRLFFDSHDALAPGDVNGTQDVYEYEPAGVGDCSPSGTSFSGASGGCVSLVSSGESNEESVFLDASETGSDVFFLTASKLLPKDLDNAFDIYDARECGGDGSRCFAREPVSPPPCSTGDGCKAPPSPQPAIFGSPASATFSGVGNLAPETAGRPAVRQKRLTGAQRLARALRACHREKGKRRRRACERKVHKRYAAKQSRNTNASKGSGR